MKNEYSLDDLRRRARAEVGERYGDLDSEPDDYISEIADGLVPVYTYDLMMYAANNLDLATMTPEILAFDGEASAVNCVAGAIYEELREAAQAEYESLHEADHAL